MKKYIFLSIITALLFSGCVKDEQAEPTPAAPVEYSNIVINELITKDTSDPYFVDGLGAGADWIELYNTGTKAINIASMWVTDEPGVETDYIQIPSTDDAISTIPPKGFLVLICGAADASGTDIPTGIVDGKIFIDMGLSSSGDNFAAIYDPEKAEIDKSDDFNGLEDDKSFGRITDGGDAWNALDTKTPGAPKMSSWQVMITFRFPVLMMISLTGLKFITPATHQLIWVDGMQLMTLQIWLNINYPPIIPA